MTTSLVWIRRTRSVRVKSMAYGSHSKSMLQLDQKTNGEPIDSSVDDDCTTTQMPCAC